MDQLPYKILRRGALILACAAGGLSPARAGCVAHPVTSVAMTMTGQKAYIPVSINEETGLFLVDTGSEQTLLDAAFADHAGAGMDIHAPRVVMTGAGNRHTLPVHMGHVRKTTIGEVSFPDWEYAMLDMSEMLPSKPQATGILGRDFLHYFDEAFDFDKGTMSFYRMSGCTSMEPPGWTGDYDAIPLKHNGRGALTMPVFVDGAYLNVVLDTGAQSLLLTRDAALRAGATPEELSEDRAGQGKGLGGSFASVRHRFKLLLIGSGVYPDATVTVENVPTEQYEADGLLGLRAFKARKLWISFATNTVFVQGAPKAGSK